MHIPAPKMPLPGHAESYRPPKEYLLTEEEEKQWKVQYLAGCRLSAVGRRLSAVVLSRLARSCYAVSAVAEGGRLYLGRPAHGQPDYCTHEHSKRTTFSASVYDELSRGRRTVVSSCLLPLLGCSTNDRRRDYHVFCHKLPYLRNPGGSAFPPLVQDQVCRTIQVDHFQQAPP